MSSERATCTRVSSHHGLLGTVVEVHVDAVPTAGGAADAAAASAEQRVVDEITRLQSVFSVYDDGSDLCRWRSGRLEEPATELVELLGDALAWQVRGGGAFNPMTGLVTARWGEAERAGVEPPDDELVALAEAIRAPRYTIVDRGGRPAAERLGDCGALDLNAVAKGFIVDRAVDAGWAVPGIERLVVNAGGDLVHRGAGTLRAGIENPPRPYDNEPPMLVVELANGAIATSGSARRGFRVGGRRFGHVLDPRTARPVEHNRSASVLAPDAATADVVATIVGVLPTAEAVAFADGLDGVECCLVDTDGGLWRSAGWAAVARR